MLVDFNSVRHGPMDKAALIAAVQQAFKEAVVQELDLFMPEAFSSMVADRVVAESVDKVDIRKTRFVMHLVHYPCRRDGVKNKFWADIQSYMTDDEKTWMEPASLDLEYFVPFEVFRDLTLKKGRVGGEWQKKIKEWQDSIGSQPDLVRDGFILLFPDPNMRSRRDYEWVDQKQWVLRNVGEP